MFATLTMAIPSMWAGEVDMVHVDGATLLVRALQRQGVSHLFSVSAGGMASVYQAAQEEGLSVVHTRHEGPAAFMADGWARMTRQFAPPSAVPAEGMGNADCWSA